MEDKARSKSIFFRGLFIILYTIRAKCGNIYY